MVSLHSFLQYQFAMKSKASNQKLVRFTCKRLNNNNQKRNL